MKQLLLSVVLGFVGLAWAGDSVELVWDDGSQYAGESVVSNSAVSAGSYYYQVTTPDQAGDGDAWRVVLDVEEGEAQLYMQQGAQPSVSSCFYRSEAAGDDSVVMAMNEGETWHILVHAEAGARWKLFAGDLHVEELAWDDGSVENGSQVAEQSQAVQGDYYYKISAASSAFGAWRSRLTVLQGEADLYLYKGTAPYINSRNTKSTVSSKLTGSDGVVLPFSSSDAGAEWYLMVHSEEGAHWTLAAGDVFVKDLGALAVDGGSSSGADLIPPCGYRFYRTSIPTDAYGWRLWLRDENGVATKDNMVYLRSGFVPLAVSSSTYDRSFSKQTLMVSDYIDAGNGAYDYVAVSGDPGDTFQLDSRQHLVEDAEFGVPLVDQSIDGYLYKTYRIQLPANLRAWEVELAPNAECNPDFALGFDYVPSPDFNDAFSELASSTINESVTIVPPAVQDGAAYITVYGQTDLQFDLFNHEPEVTQIDFLSETVNTDTNRSGWRFYAVSDIDSQKGYLGWLLELENAASGAEIAIRRNELPGRWSYRAEEETVKDVEYSDKSSLYGFLQNPAHEADIWYVGVYSPDAPLSDFTLTSSEIAPMEINTFADAERTVSDLPPKSWAFYHIDVPTVSDFGADYLGWNVRVTAASGGHPMMAIRAAMLPNGFETTSGSQAWGTGSTPSAGTEWAVGSLWATKGGDWTEYEFGTASPACMITAAKDRPLTPGSYYIGFYNEQEQGAISFDFESRPVGEGLAIDVEEISYADGEAVITDLSARDVAYFKVNVPTNAASWRVYLENISGESSLYIRRGFIPTWGQSGNGFSSPDELLNSRIDPTLTRLQKPGDEYFALLPENFPTKYHTYMDTITPLYDDVLSGELTSSFTNDAFYATENPGYYTYYLMVVSEGEGANQADEVCGTGHSSAVLHSYTDLEDVDIGEIPLDESRTVHGVYNAGETQFYRFELPANWIGWVRTDLDGLSGDPFYTYRWSNYASNESGGSSRYGGYFSGYTEDADKDHDEIWWSNGIGRITVGDFRNALQVESGEFDLTLSRWPSQDLMFDGGADSISNEYSNVVYKVSVPSQVNGEAVLGWELKLKNWTGQRPYMTISKGGFPCPYSLTKTSSDPESWGCASQPQSGDEFNGDWARNYGDWTQYKYDTEHKVMYPEYIHSMAVGRPLETGYDYYIALSSSSSEVPLNYTIESRAIGAGMSHDLDTLDFNNGNVMSASLAPRSVAYYAVDVPENSASWKVKLENLVGESSLYIRRGHVPTMDQDGRGYYSPRLASDEEDAELREIDQVVRLDKEGDEYYILLPEEDELTIPAGRYYLMVVSEGVDPDRQALSIGEGESQFVLTSLGEAPVKNMGLMPVEGVVTADVSAAAGESVLLQFEVPDDVLGLELRMLDWDGSTRLFARSGSLFSESGAASEKGYGGLYSGYDADYEGFDVITLSSPTNGIWSVVISNPFKADELAEWSSRFQVATLGPPSLSFDGGICGSDDPEVGVLAPKNWHYYQVDVPESSSGEEVLGWELRMESWSGVRPYVAVRRGELPDGNRTSSGTDAWGAESSVIKGDGWTEGSQWVTTSSPLDWTGRSKDYEGTQSYPVYMLSMATGRPLEPGTYYIGVYNDDETDECEYQLASRAIGSGMSYEVVPVSFDDGVSDLVSVDPREVAYFSVEVPEDFSSWKLRVENLSGESALYLRKDYVPTWGARCTSYESPGLAPDKFVCLKKSGDEYFTVLPEKDETVVRAGTYYLMVVGLGTGGDSSKIGTGKSSIKLHSLGVGPVEAFHHAILKEGDTFEDEFSYEAGEALFYQFTTSTNISSVEVQLVDRVGSPVVSLVKGSAFPHNGDGASSGRYGGFYSPVAADETGEIVTVPNPSRGVWSVVVSDQGKPDDVTAGQGRLVVKAVPPEDLNFDAVQNLAGGSHQSAGTLADGQHRFYRVNVPEKLNDEVVAGWYLTSEVTRGKAQLRVARGQLPEGTDRSQMNYAAPAVIVSDPLLKPGVWYVEVLAEGATDYTLTSSALREERCFSMPAEGEVSVLPGLKGGLFGDTGIDEAGQPLPEDDQSVELEKGFYHMYCVTVPEGNAGLLHTRLEALSGNPDLYIRRGNPPTLDHDDEGSGEMVDHRLDSSENTEYGSWVPYDSRYEDQLEPGEWYLLVKAEGSSNARYRLRLSSGNPELNALVQPLAFDGGAYGDQILSSDDWCYYRVEVPEHPATNWVVTYSAAAGDVDMYIRDTVPPGNYEEFSDDEDDLRHWSSDGKSGDFEADAFVDQGTYQLAVPPVRPGAVYYLGFLAKSGSNAKFSITTGASGDAVPGYPSLDFFDGVVATTLQPGEVLTYAVDVPDTAVRWKFAATNAANTSISIRQGVPPVDNLYDWSSDGVANCTSDQFLLSGKNWPWVNGETYYMSLSNGTGNAETLHLSMQGSQDPELVEGITATDGTYSDRINITWSSIPGAIYYDVWRSVTAERSNAVCIAENVSSTMCSDYDAVPGTFNYYWVNLHILPSGSSLEDWLSEEFNEGWMPGLAERIVGQDYADFEYAGGTTNIEVEADADMHWSVIEKLNWVSIISSDKFCGAGEVTIKVNMSAAQDARSGSIEIGGHTYTINQEGYGVVENIQASDGAHSEAVKVTWDEKPDATKYLVSRSESSDVSDASGLVWVSGALYDDTTAKLGHTYYYWVTPRNLGGVGAANGGDSGFKKIVVAESWQNQYYPEGDYYNRGGDNSDTDHDGYTALEEYIAGTDPIDSSSFFHVKMVGMDDQMVHFEVDPAVADRVYEVFWKAGLSDKDWKLVGSSHTQAGGMVQIDVSIGSEKGFYLQTVRPEPE